MKAGWWLNFLYPEPQLQIQPRQCELIGQRDPIVKVRRQIFCLIKEPFLFLRSKSMNVLGIRSRLGLLIKFRITTFNSRTHRVIGSAYLTYGLHPSCLSWIVSASWLDMKIASSAKRTIMASLEA